MQLHKKSEPLPVGKSYPGVNLATIMEEADAELIQRIYTAPPKFIKAVVDAAFYLHVDELLKRLAVGMISTLNK